MNLDKIKLQRLDKPTRDAQHQAEAFDYADAKQDDSTCWIVNCIDLPNVFGSGRNPREAEEAAVCWNLPTSEDCCGAGRRAEAAPR